MRRRLAAGLAALLLGLGVWQIGEAGYIQAKAWLARGLIAGAWARTLTGEATAKPWPWADTWPVARLTVPRLGADAIVLAGGSGRTLAFGPGHVAGSALPGERGLSLVAGHRDTHFGFLRELRVGDAIRVDDRAGGTHDFRVTATEVVDARLTRIDPAATRPRLVLSTCYPFEALSPGGPLRYLVFAEQAGADPASATTRGP